MKTHTPEELNQLALDLFKGLVYTDRHIADQMMIPRVFLPLSFAGEQQIDEILRNPPGLIYEYMSQASNVAVNGYPMFLSCAFLSQDETEVVLARYRELREILGEESGAPEETG